MPVQAQGLKYFLISNNPALLIQFKVKFSSIYIALNNNNTHLKPLYTVGLRPYNIREKPQLSATIRGHTMSMYLATVGKEKNPF